MPFIVVGHNDHIAWGFTNLGADVQDVYIEHLRGSGPSAEFQSPDNAWHSVLHQTELIHVKGRPDVELDVTSTMHNGVPTPIISPLLPTENASRVALDDLRSNYPLRSSAQHRLRQRLAQLPLAAFSQFGGHPRTSSTPTIRATSATTP